MFLPLFARFLIETRRRGGGREVGSRSSIILRAIVAFLVAVGRVFNMANEIMAAAPCPRRCRVSGRTQMVTWRLALVDRVGSGLGLKSEPDRAPYSFPWFPNCRCSFGP